MKAIVTEAHLRTALYVIRSLGRRGIKVICLSENDKGIGLVSKYCWKRQKVPSPKNQPNAYLKRIRELVDEHGVKVIIPTNEDSIFLFSKPDYKKKLHDVEIPIPTQNVLEKATDKGEIIKIASKLKIPIPKTYYISNHGELQKITRKIDYPAIIKLRYETGIPAGPGNRYKVVHSPDECITWYKLLKRHQPNPMIQELIMGDGYGFFALYNKNNELLASGGHKRIREQFPTGGPSTFCESNNHPLVKEFGTKLLDHLKWYGIAMVEFKMDQRDDIPKLMEINPRFWGTTPVATLAGVDFPYLLFKVANNERIDPIETYRSNVKLRFLCDDIQAYLRYMRAERSQETRSKLTSDFISDLLDPSVRDGIISFDDLIPSILYMKTGVANIFREINRRDGGGHEK